MGKYDIGKDVGELFARVNVLETSPTGSRCCDPTGGEPFDAQDVYEDLFAGNFIFKTNVLLLLRKGRMDEAVEFLEESLEEELEDIRRFDDSNIKTVAVYNAGLVNENSEAPIFTNEAHLAEIEVATKGIAKAQSTTCHPTKSCTGGWNCFRLPWSLKAVDVNKTGMWHFIKGSGCGFTLPRGRICGEPVTGSVCI